MAKDTISFRIDDHIRQAVDVIAGALERDRSYIINQALAAYIESHHWQIERLMQGEGDANKGAYAPETEVANELAKWRNLNQ